MHVSLCMVVNFDFDFDFSCAILFSFVLINGLASFSLDYIGISDSGKYFFLLCEFNWVFDV